MSFSKAEFLTLAIGQAGVKLGEPTTENGRKAMLDSFGIFGTDGNFNTFYAGLDVPNDVVPKPEDFIDVPYRLLSETIVAAGSWRSTSFAKVGVLKAAMDKLVMKPVFTDHNTDSANWVGYVAAVKWAESFTAPDGTKIPAGIDGVIRIDAKSNPKVARGAMLGVIGSNSVTVDFEWAPSHVGMDLSTFEDSIGTFAADGRMVCREATNIVDFYETSLLWLGADPFAKALDENGNPVHVDKSSVVTLGKEDPKVIQDFRETGKMRAKSCLSREETLYLASHNVFDEVPSSNIENGMKKELLEKLMLLFSVTTADEITESHIAALSLRADGTSSIDSEELTRLQGLEAPFALAKESVTSLEASVAALTSEKEALAAEVAGLKPLATASAKLLTDKKAEALRLYSVLGKGKENAAMLSLIENATSTEQADALITQFGGTIASEFSATCSACGSTEVSFQSSEINPDGHTDAVVSPSFDEIHDKFSNPLHK